MADAQLIGKHVEVVKASNKTLLGIKGKVINETKNTITLLTGNQEKKIIQLRQKRPEEIK